MYEPTLPAIITDINVGANSRIIDCRAANPISSFGIKQKIISFHDHNEKSIVKKLINKIKDGKSIALVSDAGTPCINDPGYILVKLAREENIDVLPIPGASSIISALSVSGMPIDSFCYEGYLPAKSEKRKSISFFL